MWTHTLHPKKSKALLFSQIETSRLCYRRKKTWNRGGVWLPGSLWSSCVTFALIFATALRIMHATTKIQLRKQAAHNGHDYVAAQSDDNKTPAYTTALQSQIAPTTSRAAVTPG